MSAKHGSKSVVPQQRMLRLTSLSNKAAAAYFNLKPSKLKDNTYSVSITSTSLHKQAGSQVTVVSAQLYCLLSHTTCIACNADGVLQYSSILPK